MSQSTKSSINSRFFLAALTGFIYNMQQSLKRKVTVSHGGDKRYFQDLLVHLEKIPLKQYTEETGSVQIRFDGIEIITSENTAPTSINIYLDTESGKQKFVVDNVRRRTIQIPISCRMISTDLLNSLDSLEILIDHFTVPQYYPFNWLGLQQGGVYQQQQLSAPLQDKMSSIDMQTEDNQSYNEMILQLELQYYAFNDNNIQSLSDDILKYYKFNLDAYLDAYLTPKLIIDSALQQ